MSLLDKAVIIPIDPAAICHYREIALPFINKALDQTDGENTLEGILTDLDNHKRQLFLVKRGEEFIAGVVTQMLITESGMKIGEITMAGGEDYADWDHFADTIGQWFKSLGCTCIQVIGRPGWVRHLKPKGFENRYTILRKGL